MSQQDWVTGEPQRPPFKDIRNQRDAVAEEKATLCRLIGHACNRPPSTVVNGSIDITRRWMDARKSAMKVAGSRRSSVHELTSALSSMDGFK